MSNRDEIKSLDVRSQCRDKLPIWYGSRDNYYHGVRELLANASDEITNNFDSGEIHVELSEDGRKISVFDTGRGIPINGITDGKPNYELLFETLFSGTNYENDTNGKVTTGVNGVGTAVLNHTSKLFLVEVYNNNKYHFVEYNNGGHRVNASIDNVNNTNIEHGTRMTIVLDDEVYTNTVFNQKEISNVLNALAGHNSKLTIYFKYNGDIQEYSYDTLGEYLHDKSNMAIVNNVVFPTKEIKSSETNTIECVWNVSTEPFQETSLNYTALIEHGTIYDGFINGMRRVFNKDSKIKFTTQDIEMSFGFVCSLLSTNAEYANQVKFSTAKQLYRTLTSDYIIENMEIFKAENPQEFDKILKHLQQINTFNTRNEKSIKNIKKKLSEKSDTFTNRIESLVDCRKHGDGTELFICEGKSALSSVIASRNADFQAAMAIRGKILSTLKANTEQIFNNQIIMDIIKVLGCECTINQNKSKINVKFDIDNLRYEKVIITVDADPDGSSILCLLTTMFYRLMPEMLKQGRVYIALTPLYEITTKDNRLLYASNEEEKDEIINNNKVLKIQRNKGLGETDAETMAETTMNPDTRNIERIIVNNDEDMEYYFNKWMGTDVSLRREHIETNLDRYAKDLD